MTASSKASAIARASVAPCRTFSRRRHHGFAAVLDRLGVERRLYTAGAKKSLLDPFRPQDPEDVDRLMEIMTEIHGDFKSMVRQRRGDRLKAADDELFEGQIWTGRKAAELGLVDGLGELPVGLQHPVPLLGCWRRVGLCPVDEDQVPRHVALLGLDVALMPDRRTSLAKIDSRSPLANIRDRH